MWTPKNITVKKHRTQECRSSMNKNWFGYVSKHIYTSVQYAFNKTSFNPDPFRAFSPFSSHIAAGRHLKHVMPAVILGTARGIQPTSVHSSKYAGQPGYQWVFNRTSLPPQLHSSRAVWESRWPSWVVRPNEPSGFRGRKELLNHASTLVTACP